MKNSGLAYTRVIKGAARRKLQPRAVQCVEHVEEADEEYRRERRRGLRRSMGAGKLVRLLCVEGFSLRMGSYWVALVLARRMKCGLCFFDFLFRGGERGLVKTRKFEFY